MDVTFLLDWRLKNFFLFVFFGSRDNLILSIAWEVFCLFAFSFPFLLLRIVLKERPLSIFVENGFINLLFAY